jgi:hypothetical protein
MRKLFKEKIMMTKPKGWKLESARHSLAAKGVKTGKKVQVYAGNPKLYKKKEKPYDEVGNIIAYEEGTLSNEETIVLFSHLIKNGHAWSLQGMYGRQAQAFIDAGIIDRNGKINWAENDNSKMSY